MSDIKKLDLFMPNSIGSISTPSSGSGSGSDQIQGESFSDILKSALSGVNDAQAQASVALEQALVGDTDVHDTMIALQKADTSLKMMLEVRNKLLEAYQEVLRTQV